MGQLAGTTFGTGIPYGFATSPWGYSPYGTQTISQQPYFQPSLGQLSGGYGAGPNSPWQQIAQPLHIVTQQLQQVQFLQQQQLQHLQQLLQLVPAQLQQLQQLIQIVPQQIQHLQQQSQPLGTGLPGSFGVGLIPQVYSGAATSQIM